MLIKIGKIKETSIDTDEHDVKTENLEKKFEDTEKYILELMEKEKRIEENNPIDDDEYDIEAENNEEDDVESEINELNFSDEVPFEEEIEEEDLEEEEEKKEQPILTKNWKNFKGQYK